MAKLETYDIILNMTDEITIICNDFFGYACADAVTVDWQEYSGVLTDVVEKWGSDGLNAFCSMYRCMAPLTVYQTEKFNEAFKYLVALNPFETSGQEIL